MPLTKGTGDKMGQKKVQCHRKVREGEWEGEKKGRGQGEIKIVWIECMLGLFIWYSAQIKAFVQAEVKWRQSSRPGFCVAEVFIMNFATTMRTPILLTEFTICLPY